MISAALMAKSGHFMPIIFRFLVPLILTLTVMGFAIAPAFEKYIFGWFENDIQIRSRLIFNSTRFTVSRLVRENSKVELSSLFDRISDDERVAGVAICNTDGVLIAQNKNWPNLVSCKSINDGRNNDRELIEITEKTLSISSFNLDSADSLNQTMLIVHDLSYIKLRLSSAQFYFAAFLSLISIVAGIITIFIARITIKSWADSILSVLKFGPGSENRKKISPELLPLIEEINARIHSIETTSPIPSILKVEWNQETLKKYIQEELPNVEIIVASNREPIIHEHSKSGSIILKKPASGLVTALEPILRSSGGVWVAHGSGSADREVVDSHDHFYVKDETYSYKLSRLWLTEEEEDGYYHNFSNDGMWPLCHLSYVRPKFNEHDWRQYMNVNKKFADRVVRECKTSNPIVLVQDYHLALVPKYVREKLPNATIITFWHIPWPNPEVFGICPWRDEILNGLLGSSIMGFHTQLHCNNFIESVDRFLESNIDRERFIINVGSRQTWIKNYPISIPWSQSTETSIDDDSRNHLIKEFNLPFDAIIAVGVERFDFTKGIPDRFLAIENFLEQYPQYLNKFFLIQIAAPTRSKLNNYQNIQIETVELAKKINEKFESIGYEPIKLFVEHYDYEQIQVLFKGSNICIVSSLHDGMNLVAKEFVAARSDERGVLILSSFTGAAKELSEALIINPFDIKKSADKIFEAIQMPTSHQTARMKIMRNVVSENNIFFWASRMLIDAARIREKEYLKHTFDRISEHDTKI